MAEPGLIRDYLAALSAELPAPIVDELANGLEQARRHYLGQGLDPEAAARAAVAESGEPQVVMAAFTGASSARAPPAAYGDRAGGRRLLGGGIGHQPGRGLARAGRARSARRGAGHRHRPAGRRCFRAALPVSHARRARAAPGTAVLDATVTIAVLRLAVPAVIWPVIVAAAASAVRHQSSGPRAACAWS